MNCTLCAFNAKYAHTNPAIRSLKKAANRDDAAIALKEYTINTQPMDILADLYEKDTLLYGFSCYIWNIEHILKTASALKKLNPSAVILLGGPEVSFDAESFLWDYPFIDYIIAGEGETAFALFLDFFSGKIQAQSVPSLYYRKDSAVCSNEKACLIDLDSLPMAYDDLSSLARRVIYYESSRGCPFQCAFCLSSVSEGVRFRSLELVKQDIDAFFAANAMKVKFVDRTFNADRQRAKEIIRYILQKDGETGFHFEIAAGLLDEETIELLKNCPKGRIQIEAGIQSVHPPALAAVRRKESFGDIQRNLAPIIQAGSVHTHIDLIAGLPHESYADFKASFDSAFFLKADNLQLGFLKLLRGSALRRDAQTYGIEYLPFAPYTVLKTGAISFEELNQLERIEDLLQKYYNSASFNYTVYFLARQKGSAFALFEELCAYIHARKPEGELSQAENQAFLFDFAVSFMDLTLLKDLMRFDLCKGKAKTPLPDYLQCAGDALCSKADIMKEYQKASEQKEKPNRKDMQILYFTLDIEALEKRWEIVRRPAIWLIHYASGQKILLKELQD